MIKEEEKNEKKKYEQSLGEMLACEVEYKSLSVPELTTAKHTHTHILNANLHLRCSKKKKKTNDKM